MKEKIWKHMNNLESLKVIILLLENISKLREWT